MSRKKVKFEAWETDDDKGGCYFGVSAVSPASHGTEISYAFKFFKSADRLTKKIRLETFRTLRKETLSNIRSMYLAFSAEHKKLTKAGK